MPQDFDSAATAKANELSYPADNPNIPVADAERARYSPILDELTAFEESLKQAREALIITSSHEDEWDIL